MFNMSEAAGPVESMTLKCPLNITQRQHWGQLSCQNQTTGIARTRTHTYTHARTHSLSACWCFLPLSVPFFPRMQNADETSQPLVHSLRRNCHSNPNICMNTNTHGVQWKMRGREGRRQAGRQAGREDWERLSGKTAKKASVPLSFCVFDWTKSYKHMNTPFPPTVFSIGIFILKSSDAQQGLGPVFASGLRR